MIRRKRHPAWTIIESVRCEFPRQLGYSARFFGPPVVVADFCLALIGYGRACRGSG